MLMLSFLFFLSFGPTRRACLNIRRACKCCSKILKGLKRKRGELVQVQNTLTASFVFLSSRVHSAHNFGSPLFCSSNVKHPNFLREYSIRVELERKYLSERETWHLAQCMCSFVSSFTDRVLSLLFRANVSPS